MLYFIVVWCCGEEILKLLRSVLEGKLHSYQWSLTKQGPMSKKNQRWLLLNFFEIQGNKNTQETQKILKQINVGSIPADIRHQQYQEETPVKAAGLQTALPGVIGCPHPVICPPQASGSFGSKRRKQPQAQASIQEALPVCSQQQRLLQLS